MVKDPSEYRWSSYQCNALGKKSDLLTPHERYLALGENDLARQINYKCLFNVHVEDKVLDDIRRCAQSGLAIVEIHGLKNKSSNLRVCEYLPGKGEGQKAISHFSKPNILL